MHYSLLHNLMTLLLNEKKKLSSLQLPITVFNNGQCVGQSFSPPEVSQTATNKQQHRAQPFASLEQLPTYACIEQTTACMHRMIATSQVLVQVQPMQQSSASTVPVVTRSRQKTTSQSHKFQH